MFRNCLKRRKEQFTVEDPVILFIIIIIYYHMCSAQTVTRIGLLEEIPRSGVQIPCLYLKVDVNEK
jgi:hypothetical protein